VTMTDGERAVVVGPTTASLRFQCSGTPDHQDLTVERAFADFVFGNLILHLFVINYMG
jgi:hypothetical protein